MKDGYADPRIETLEDFVRVVSETPDAVVLVEGTRKVAQGDFEVMRRLGTVLAERMPGVVFRTGNAEGSDTAFAEGVAEVDAGRLEYVMPTEGMGRKRRVAAARTFALAGLSKAAENRLAEETTEATPKAERLVSARLGIVKNQRLAAKGSYLLRDTLKVTGAPELGLAPATAGIFYVNEVDPLGGGTGHTIRVCLRQRVPVVFQHVWREWG